MEPGPPVEVPVYLVAFERRTEGFQTRRITMSENAGTYEGHLAVPYLAFEVGLAIAAPGWRLPGEITLPVCAPGGPAQGTFAWQMAREPGRWAELARQEAALGGANPFAQIMTWRAQLATGDITPEKIREEALAGAATNQGLSPWGRRAIALGLALSGDLEYAGMAIEELARRYPGSPAVDQALRDYAVARSSTGDTSADPLDPLRERLAHKEPGRALAREHLSRWARTWSGALSTMTRVAEDWIETEPNNPLPRHDLAVARLRLGQDPAAAEDLSRQALDRALAGWLWVYQDAPDESDVRRGLLGMRRTRVETALASGAACDALAHCQIGLKEAEDRPDQQRLFAALAGQATHLVANARRDRRPPAPPETQSDDDVAEATPAVSG
jgi:hypothetical protein